MPIRLLRYDVLFFKGKNVLNIIRFLLASQEGSTLIPHAVCRTATSTFLFVFRCECELGFCPIMLQPCRRQDTSE